ncbi:hypothetical protein GCM10025789_29550 [Tessaracoccus lubricantis]|uniref:PBP domain-containing protein n=1 Tax=Tessaracoccus lubricantis TaxID=545543 RepID=A0ABP9FLR5_9ACTN
MQASSRTSAKRRVAAALALLAVGVATVPLASPGQARADEAAASSAVTVTNKDYALSPDDAPFPDLEVTVSQTSDLVGQGIRITYKGGALSSRPQGSVGGENFLQVAQCWGEDPDNPGHPDRRTCQYGGTNMYGARRDGGREADSVRPQDERFTAAGQWADWTAMPFVAWNADGIVDEAEAPADKVLSNLTPGADGTMKMKPEKEWVNLATNRYYNATSTNEISWAPFGPDGTGSIPFEIQTAAESPGLGCGNPITANATVTGSSCWLVVIPRGLSDNGAPDISSQTSGLWWDAWEHHLAVKLDFKPLGSRCELGAIEKQLAGSELAASAIASWQPVVCQQEGGAPFTLAQVPEPDALLSAAGLEPSALALASRPLDIDNLGWDRDPLAYAPVALGGISVSYVVDAAPNPQTAPEQYKVRRGLPLPEMRLTPRLLAKLLTASYLYAVPTRAEVEHVQGNPWTIVYDPDFLEINDPEWAAQAITDMSVADALMPLGRSDLARQVWEYILADPEAKAWLDGQPDPWGMKVNPWYSTNPAINPSGVPLELPTDSFPKADPIERPDNTTTEPINGTGAVNLVTWRPYSSSFADGARRVLRGDGMILGDWDRLARPPRFSSSLRQLPGNQHVIGLSSTPAAQQYQTTTALLRNPAGQFVAPTPSALSAAAGAMEPVSGHPQVLWFDPSSNKAKAAKTAYPLTLPVYAALNPQQKDAELRGAYADLITYAVADGQQPGTSDGQLPPGYAPLPDAWRKQALAAAEAIDAGGWPQPKPSPTPSASPKPSSSATTAPGGSPSPIGTVTPSVTASPSAAPTTAPGTPAPNTPGANAPVYPQPPLAAPSTPAGSPVDGASVPPVTGGTDPKPNGAPAGALVGAETPTDPPLGPISAVVPATGLVGLAAALGIPVISRIRRQP